MKFELLLSFILVQLQQQDRPSMAHALRQLADELDPATARRLRQKRRELRRLRRRPRGDV